MMMWEFKKYYKEIFTVFAFVLAAFVPVWVKSPYYLDILIIILVNSMLAMTFVMLLKTGLINLGTAAFFGIGAYSSTILAIRFGLSFWISLPLAVLITGLIGLVLGFLLIGSGSSGFSFVVLSSVIGMCFSVVVGNLSFLGGYNGISNIPSPGTISLPIIPEIIFGGPNDKVPYFYLALTIFLFVVLVLKAFYAAWVGRAWKATGLNPRLAESLGINTFFFKLISFVVASMIAGLVGSFYAHYEGFITPDAFGMWINIYFQIYAILGGLGYAVLGPLVGASVMTILPESLRMMKEIAPIFTGLLLILFILFLPQGLLGILTWRKSITERSLKIGKAVKAMFFN